MGVADGIMVALVSSESDAMAATMATIAETLTPVRDMIVGYRHQLIQGGIADEAADQMAADVHRFVLAQITRAVLTTPPPEPGAQL